MEQVKKGLPLAALIGTAIGLLLVFISLTGADFGFLRPWHVGIAAGIAAAMVCLRLGRKK